MDVQGLLAAVAILACAYAAGLHFSSFVFSAMGNKSASRAAVRLALIWCVISLALCVPIIAAGWPS